MSTPNGNKPSFGHALQALTLINQKNPSSQQLTRLYGSGLLSDLLDADLSMVDRDAVRTALGLGATLPEIFHLTVEANSLLSSMVERGGYNWVNPGFDILKPQLVIGSSGDFEARYFQFDEDCETEAALFQIVGQNDPGNRWLPARVEHLLALGATFPNEQRKFPIIALGSTGVIGERVCAPEIWQDRSGRYLSVYPLQRGVSRLDRLLAVREVQQ